MTEQEKYPVGRITFSNPRDEAEYLQRQYPGPWGLAETLLVVSDSSRGYGSTDGPGDLYGNYGFYEQALANRYRLHDNAHIIPKGD